MHKCVCIWRYILQNYNYKLHFQNLSIYHILHVSIGTLGAENLDICIDYDPWNIYLLSPVFSNGQLYVANIDIKIFEVPPWVGHAFPRGGGG
jgi:hypothetical protein